MLGVSKKKKTIQCSIIRYLQNKYISKRTFHFSSCKKVTCTNIVLDHYSILEARGGYFTRYPNLYPYSTRKIKPKSEPK